MTAGHIYTVAGDPQSLVGGGPLPALQAALANPIDTVPDRAGNLVLADSGNAFSPALAQVIASRTGTFYGQKMKAGYIYVVAGEGGSVSGDGGPALKAGLGLDMGQMPLDYAGNLVIADSSANSIRVVAEHTGTIYGQKMTAGDIYAVAGNGSAGFSGDGGPATSAELNSPRGVAVDSAGNLVISDSGNNRIRVVAVRTGTFYGRKMTAGDIYTVAGGSAATRLSNPGPIAIDGTGSILAGELGGLVKVLAEKPGTFYGQKMTAGGLYTVAGTGYVSYSGDGGPATRAEFYRPEDLATDSAGNLLINDAGNQRVRVIAVHTGTLFGMHVTKGDIYTVAGNGKVGYSGSGGLATASRLDYADSIAADHAGNLAIVSGQRILVVAARTGTFYGQKMTAGHIYTVAGTGQTGDSGDGGPAIKAEFFQPGGVTVDHYGDLLVSDHDNVRAVATTSGTHYGVKMKAGDIYNVAGRTGVAGFSGDGGPALRAEFFGTSWLAVDAAGNLLISDGSNRVRVVAATTGTSYGRAMTADDVYTIAGDGNRGYFGNGKLALRTSVLPYALAVDAAGNVVISDHLTRVGVVAVKSGTYYGIAMKAGHIYTVAGSTEHNGYTGDGGPAIDAQISFGGLVPDSAGNLLIGDDSGRIRQISAGPGTATHTLASHPTPG
jgi:hypothetical protein